MSKWRLKDLDVGDHLIFMSKVCEIYIKDKMIVFAPLAADGHLFKANSYSFGIKCQMWVEVTKIAEVKAA